MVSIIVPVYNSGFFLRECLSSIQQQSYTNIEVICIDDGSTDNSATIINEYVTSDKRFQYIYKNHTNAGEARNIGITASKGDYLMFLDSDDFFAPNMVELALDTSLSTNADITIFQYKLYYEETGRLSSQIYGINTNRKSPFNLIDLQKHRFELTNIAVWNKLYKSSFLKQNKILFKSHAAINDVFFSWCSLILANKIDLCRNVGVFYRINTGTAISDNLLRTSDCFIDAFREINEYVQEIGRWKQLKDDLLDVESKQFSEFFSRLSKKDNLQDKAYLFKIDMIAFFEQFNY